MADDSHSWLTTVTSCVADDSSTLTIVTILAQHVRFFQMTTIGESWRNRPDAHRAIAAAGGIGSFLARCDRWVEMGGAGMVDPNVLLLSAATRKK